MGRQTSKANSRQSTSRKTRAYATVSTLAIVAAAAAAADAREVRFNIPSQDLSQALLQFAQQSNVEFAYSQELMVSPELIRGHQSAGIVGSYRLEEALARLAEGNGLAFRYDDDTDTVVVRVDATARQHLQSDASIAARVESGTARQAIARDSSFRRISPPASSRRNRNMTGEQPISSEGPRAQLANVALSEDDSSRQTGGGVQQRGRPAGADSDDAQVVEEIVVTSRRRTERLLDVPSAITAFSENVLEAKGIAQVENIARFVPNVQSTRIGVGNPSQVAFSMRGVAEQDHIILNDPRVGMYLNGVYLGRNMGNNLNLANIKRVEVLRGPQGTLYGRNVVGGAINIITYEPGEKEVTEITAEAGSRARINANFYTDFRLTDELGVSMQGNLLRRDGIGKALRRPDARKDVGQLQNISGRVSVRWEASPDLAFTASFDGADGSNGQISSGAQLMPGATEPGIFEASGGTFGFLTDPEGPAADVPGGGAIGFDDLPEDFDDTNTNEAQLLTQENKSVGGSFVADWAISDFWDTQFLFNFRNMSYKGGLDDEAVFADLESFPEVGDADQIAVEWQNNFRVGKFDSVVGAMWFHEYGHAFSGPVGLPGTDPEIAQDFFFEEEQTTDSIGIYGHTTYNVTDALSLSGGVRYSYDEKDASAFFPSFTEGTEFREENWDEVVFDASVSYKISENVSIHYKESKGYQNGGFNPRPFGGPDQFTAFDPLTARNHEGSIKGSLSFVTFSATGFLTNYKELPLQFARTTQQGFVVTIENAGKSRAKGVELESAWHLPGFTPDGSFTLELNGGYLDSEIKNLAEGTVGIGLGDRPALNPEWNVALAGQYRHRLANGDRFHVRVDYSFRDEMFGQSSNNQFNKFDKRDLMNINVTYENVENGWSLGFVGHNIWNEQFDVGRVDLPFNGFTLVTRNNDRSFYGVRFEKRFAGF